MISRISAVVIAIVIWFPSYGQLGMSDKDILEARKLSVKKNYEHIGVARILTGKHYTLKQLHAINSQLFREMNPRVGKLVYDGILFSDLVIQYDLSTQQVIVLLKTLRKSHGFSSMGMSLGTFLETALLPKGSIRLDTQDRGQPFTVKEAKPRLQPFVRSKLLSILFHPTNFI